GTRRLADDQPVGTLVADPEYRLAARLTKRTGPAPENLLAQQSPATLWIGRGTPAARDRHLCRAGSGQIGLELHADVRVGCLRGQINGHRLTRLRSLSGAGDRHGGLSGLLHWRWHASFFDFFG
ncbi:MAG: hypothetical protein R3E83_17215, partial [Burkholderiaceae bacterium]